MHIHLLSPPIPTVGDPAIWLLLKVRLADFKCSPNNVIQQLEGLTHFQGEIPRLFRFFSDKTLSRHLKQIYNDVFYFSGNLRVMTIHTIMSLWLFERIT